MDLNQRRRDKANTFFEQADLGYEVVEANGWEQMVPGRELSRVLFVVDDENSWKDTLKKVLIVTFIEGSDEIEEVTIDGHRVKAS